MEHVREFFAAERGEDGKAVGTSLARSDALGHVTGQTQFYADRQLPGMLHLRMVRSPHDHARILSVDIGPALAIPGVHAVLLADDVPGQRLYGLEFPDQPVLADDVVRYVGEPIAVVAGDHPETARRGADAVRVTYEPLESIADMEQAIAPGAPELHPWGNVLRHIHIEHGDPDADADVWVQGSYETGMQDQAALGPEAGLAIPAEDGGVDLFVTTQWLHADRRQIAPCLGLPEERVRVHLAGVGGAGQEERNQKRGDRGQGGDARAEGELHNVQTACGTAGDVGLRELRHEI